MVKSLYLLETLYGIRVSHSVTMDQYIHSVSFDLSTKCRRSSDGRLGVCDFKPMRINDGSPEIAANWLQQPKKRKQTRQKWKFSSVKQTKQTRKDNHKLFRKGKWSWSHTCFYNYICFKGDRIRSEDEGWNRRILFSLVSLHHSFMTHIDTLTNRKYSGCNCKHCEKYIPSLWTVNKYKQHFIPQEQTFWAKLVLRSSLCLTETINT